MPMFKRFTLVMIVTAMLVGAVFDRAYSQFDVDCPEPLSPLEGTLFLNGGGAISSEMRARFTQLAGGERARIVVPTADLSDPLNVKKLDVWLEQNPENVEFLHVESRDQIADSNFETMLARATGVWFSGGKQTKIVEAYGCNRFIDPSCGHGCY